MMTSLAAALGLSLLAGQSAATKSGPVIPGDEAQAGTTVDASLGCPPNTRPSEVRRHLQTQIDLIETKWRGGSLWMRPRPGGYVLDGGLKVSPKGGTQVRLRIVGENAHEMSLSGDSWSSTLTLAPAATPGQALLLFENPEHCEIKGIRLILRQSQSKGILMKGRVKRNAIRDVRVDFWGDTSKCTGILLGKDSSDTSFNIVEDCTVMLVGGNPRNAWKPWDVFDRNAKSVYRPSLREIWDLGHVGFALIGSNTLANVFSRSTPHLCSVGFTTQDLEGTHPSSGGTSFRDCHGQLCGVVFLLHPEGLLTIDGGRSEHCGALLCVGDKDLPRWAGESSVRLYSHIFDAPMADDNGRFGFISNDVLIGLYGPGVFLFENVQIGLRQGGQGSLFGTGDEKVRLFEVTNDRRPPTSNGPSRKILLRGVKRYVMEIGPNGYSTVFSGKVLEASRMDKEESWRGGPTPWIKSPYAKDWTVKVD